MVVIPFPAPSAVELKGRALQKIAELIALLPAYVEAHHAASVAGPDSEAASRVAQALRLLQFVDDTLELLEDIAAPTLLNKCDDRSLTMLEIQCDLTNLRMKAFAEIRSSRVFVSDFQIMLEEHEFTPALFFAA